MLKLKLVVSTCAFVHPLQPTYRLDHPRLPLPYARPVLCVLLLALVLVPVGCSKLLDIFSDDSGPCSISGNCKVFQDKSFRVTIYNHNNYDLQYFSGKFNNPDGDYKIDGLPVDIVDIYFEADDSFPDKLFDVRLNIGETIVDSVEVRYTTKKSVNKYAITLKRGDSILWPHGFEGLIAIDSL